MACVCACACVYAKRVMSQNAHEVLRQAFCCDKYLYIIIPELTKHNYRYILSRWQNAKYESEMSSELLLENDNIVFQGYCYSLFKREEDFK